MRLEQEEVGGGRRGCELAPLLSVCLPAHPAPHTGTVFSRVLPGEYIQAGQQGQLKMGQVEPPPELKVSTYGEGGTWRGSSCCTWSDCVMHTGYSTCLYGWSIIVVPFHAEYGLSSGTNGVDVEGFRRGGTCLVQVPAAADAAGALFPVQNLRWECNGSRMVSLASTA